VATLKAAEAPPLSPTLEGKTTLETFLPKQSRWLRRSTTAMTTSPIDLLPAFLISYSGSRGRVAAAGFRWCLLIMAHTISVESSNSAFGRGQRRAWSQLIQLIEVVLVRAQRSPKQSRMRQRCISKDGNFRGSRLSTDAHVVSESCNKHSCSWIRRSHERLLQSGRRRRCVRTSKFAPAAGRKY
jgi:hypothetical protein